MENCSEMPYRDHLFDVEQPVFRRQIRDDVRRAVEFGEMPKPGSVLYGAIQVSPPILVGIARIEVRNPEICIYCGEDLRTGAIIAIRSREINAHLECADEHGDLPRDWDDPS